MVRDVGAWKILMCWVATGSFAIPYDHEFQFRCGREVAAIIGVLFGVLTTLRWGSVIAVANGHVGEGLQTREEDEAERTANRCKE